MPGIHHVPYGDASAIEEVLFNTTLPPDEVAAIIVEPVLGEGGYIVPPREFLHRLRGICDEHGILLICDEVQSGVQCGMGRTGKMFAAEHFEVYPDIFVLAKGLASGFPLGAMMAQREVMTWPSGSHGSTCGGNPVCIAAAMATLDLLEGGLCDNAAKVGALLKRMLEDGLADNPMVKEVRGLGLMLGVEFKMPTQANAVANLCYQRGLLVLECGVKSIRWSPPLILTEKQAEVGARIFVEACREVALGHPDKVMQAHEPAGEEPADSP